MPAQSTDVIHAERLGISGKVTAQEIADLAIVPLTQAAYDALTPAQQAASGFVVIIG